MISEWRNLHQGMPLKMFAVPIHDIMKITYVIKTNNVEYIPNDYLLCRKIVQSKNVEIQ